jgi:hypothetical protein
MRWPLLPQFPGAGDFLCSSTDLIQSWHEQSQEKSSLLRKHPAELELGGGTHGDVLSMPLDLRDMQQVEQIIRSTMERY